MGIGRMRTDELVTLPTHRIRQMVNQKLAQSMDDLGRGKCEASQICLERDHRLVIYSWVYSNSLFMVNARAFHLILRQPDLSCLANMKTRQTRLGAPWQE